MELYDEKLEQKKSKIPMILGICIAVLAVITAIIVYVIIYLQNSIMTIKINGNRNNEIEKIFYIESSEEETNLYMPIIKMAQYLDYEGFTGDYKDKSEDKTKCHVTSEYETAIFTKDSDVIMKVTEDSEDEYIIIDKPVFEKDGELYTTIDGIEKAFNVAFYYDEELKNIDIYSMEYLVQVCVTNLKLEKYSDEFGDQKAILEGMIIIEQDGRYGVINATNGEAILEAKYEEIKYLPVTTDFLVKSNGKYGVVTKDAKVKIKMIYDQINIMDYEYGLYLVKNNNAYGVLNANGEMIIEPEYKQIGINIDKYSQNGVENKYILLDEIIPIQNTDNLWGFFNIKGEKITDFKYTGVGCQSLPVNNSYPVVVIPSYKIIVVLKDKYYNLITLDGEELISGEIINSVYLKVNSSTEQNQFFMTSSNNTKVINIEEWLASIGR